VEKGAYEQQVARYERGRGTQVATHSL